MISRKYHNTIWIQISKDSRPWSELSFLPGLGLLLKQLVVVVFLLFFLNIFLICNSVAFFFFFLKEFKDEVIVETCGI